MLNKIKRPIRFLLDVLILAVGWIAFAFSGRTPKLAGGSLIRLFCASGGRTNDLIGRLISLRHPPRRLSIAESVLPGLNASDGARAAAALRERGYFVFEQRLPDEMCDQLLDFALTQPATTRPGTGQAQAPITGLYDARRPLAVRYEYQEQDLINSPLVQSLMADPALINAAQEYLRAQPVADIIYMWWHTAFSDQPDSDAAQFYHFDMDRIKWVKFFIYLTDVGTDNGPHCFIAGSHNTNGIPPELLSKGYVRLLDQEVEQHYKPEDFVEFAAPRGTIIAEDTRGLHKGQHVRGGHRLVLQIQFSNSLFGPPYPKICFDNVQDANLAALIDSAPRMYSGYLPVRSKG